ncbi:MAG: CHAT domain-containing protein, partial [Acidobacteria bacterium]|nr:CHAT domain-containing protein [Acidobacteriota bacterium]
MPRPDDPTPPSRALRILVCGLAILVAGSDARPSQRTVEESLDAAERALAATDIEGARSLLEPFLSEAEPPMAPPEVRVRAARIGGDVEAASTRLHPAEVLYRRALSEASRDPARHTDELVLAHTGLAHLASLQGETTVAEAEFRLAQRLLTGAGDAARATFHEKLAATLAVGGCGFPCRVEYEGLESAQRAGLQSAEAALAIRRRIAPGSEGEALRVRARCLLDIQGASREELLDAHWDLFEAIRLLSREGQSRIQLGDAYRTFASTMNNAASLTRDNSAPIEEGARVLPSGSSWTRFRLLMELTWRRETSGDTGQRWACDFYDTGREMSRFLRPSRESFAGWANMHAVSFFAGARVALREQGVDAAIRVLEEVRGRALAAVLAGRAGAAPKPADPSLLSERRRLDRRTMSPDGTRDPAVVARLWELSARMDAPHLGRSLPRATVSPTSSLPKGTVLLYFPIPGVRLLFVLENGRPIRSVGYGMDFQELWPLVVRYRKLLSDPSSDPHALTEIGSVLYDGLLSEVDADIQRAERVIVSTDGFMEHIPFAALLRVRGDDARFLGTWKPLSHVLSLSVLAQLQARPPAPRNGGTAIFADPRNPRFDALP